MNRDLSDRPGEGEQRDPVADFFARERAGIRELPAGTDRWESIVTEASRPHRRHVMSYLAGAAAVVLIGGVVWGTSTGPSTDLASDTASSTSASVPTVTVTKTVPPKVVPAPSDGASSAPSTPVAQTPQSAPKTFNIVSMTNAGDKHLYVLGSATCPKGECAVVIASDDDGATWTTRASFTTLTTPGSRTTPDWSHQLVGIRFANPMVGYVYGSTTKRTTDGGRSWTDVDVDRRTVLSLETDGKQVWMATARSCQHEPISNPFARGCQDLEPRTGPITSATTEPVTFSGMPGAGEDAWVTLDGSEAYYNVTTGLGAPGPLVAMRLSGKPGLLPTPKECDSTNGMWVWTTANTSGTLIGVCRTAAGPSEEYSLAVSDDRGSTWTTRAAPGLGRPSETGVWLTATDAKHLVAVRHGRPSSAGLKDEPTTLLTSADGGGSWRPAKVASTDSASWAGAAGGTLVYAISGGLSYWRSNDSGATFENVPLRK